MSPFFEPRHQREQRLARQRERYPQLEISDFDAMTEVDAAARIQTGSPLTQFGRDAEDLAVRNLPNDDERRPLALQNFQSVYDEELAAPRPQPQRPQVPNSPVLPEGFEPFRPLADSPRLPEGFEPFVPEEGGGFLSRVTDLALNNPVTAVPATPLRVGRELLGGDVRGAAEAILPFGAGAAIGNLIEGDPAGAADVLGGEVLGQARGALPPTQALDLFRDRQAPTSTLEGFQSIGQGFLDIDTVTGLPLRTVVRQGSQAFTAPIQAGREQFALEQQGGIGFGLEGAAPFEQLRRIPGIERDLFGTDISIFDTTLGLSDVLLDVGGVVGAAQAIPRLERGGRVYFRVTSQLPVGLSLRDIEPDLRLLRGALGLPDEAPLDDVIEAATSMRPGIRATALSQARGPEAIQIAQQQLDLIDSILPKLAESRAVDPATDAVELFIARDRNTGQYIMGSGAVTPDRALAATFLSEADLRAFADTQIFPVDPIRLSSFGEDVAENVLPRGAVPRQRAALSAPAADDLPTRPRSTTFDPAEGLPQQAVRQPPPTPVTPEPPTPRPPRAPGGTEPVIGPQREPFVPEPGPERAVRTPVRTVAEAVSTAEQKSVLRQMVTFPLEALGLARAFKTSFDVSMPFRQGAPFISRPEWVRAWRPMFRALFSADFAARTNDELIGGPLTAARANAGDASAIAAMRRAVARQVDRLDLTEFGEGVRLTAREEGYVTRLADAVPGIRASQRAAVVFLNSLRTALYDNKVAQWDRMLADGAIDASRRAKLGRGLSRWINIGTGRADLPDRIAQSDLLVAANQSFFSARILISRGQAVFDAARLLEPTGKLGIDPLVRREMARDLVGFVGAGTGALLAMREFGWIDIEIDPRSPDFAKGRVPLTGERYDPWAGFSQVARYTTQLVTNQRLQDEGQGVPKSVQPAQEGGFFVARALTVNRFVRSKIAPGLPAVIWDLSTGETFLGDPLEIDTATGALKYLGTQYVPLAAEDVIQAARAEGLLGVAKASPAQVGIGYNQYQGLADVKDVAAMEMFTDPFTGEPLLYKDLNRGQARQVDESEPVQDYFERFRDPDAREPFIDDLPEPTELDPLSRESANDFFAQHERTQERLQLELKGLLEQELNPEALREAISQFKNDMWVSGQAIFDGRLTADTEIDPDLPIEDLLGDLYWSAPAATTVTEAGDVRVDFDQQSAARLEILDIARQRGVDITYILGTGEDTYRGTRYEDETVRDVIVQFEASRTAIEQSGFFDLRDDSWIAFKQLHPSLANHGDYWDWRADEVAAVAQDIVDTTGALKSDAEREAVGVVARYNTVTQFNEYYREQFRHAWVTGFPDLARLARDFGYFDPDTPESDFLFEQGGGTPQPEQQSSSGFSFPRFGSQ